MSAHNCQTFNPGCYRCDLNLDEIRGYVDSLVVTPHTGVVHDPDCTFVSGVASKSVLWSDSKDNDDRPCSRCLPDGIPAVA